MVSAANLPALFAASTWQSGGSYLNDGASCYCASVGGAWVRSTEPDRWHVTEADFNSIAGAQVSGGALVIGGTTYEVSGARSIAGVKYLLLQEPEE